MKSIFTYTIIALVLISSISLNIKGKRNYYKVPTNTVLNSEYSTILDGLQTTKYTLFIDKDGNIIEELIQTVVRDTTIINEHKTTGNLIYNKDKAYIVRNTVNAPYLDEQITELDIINKSEIQIKFKDGIFSLYKE